MKRIVVSALSLVIVTLLVSISLLGTAASELEQELMNSVGDVNEDPKFDLLINAPESYRVGDDITVTVSVVNIASDISIDYLAFKFNYDNTKLFLTNDIDEANQGALDCIDIESLGGQWEQFCMVNSNFDELTPTDIRNGVQAVPNNDGLIDAAILTTDDIFDSISEDNVIVFTFTFKVLDDSVGDIGMFISHSSVNGAKNGDSMFFFKGNGGYAIIFEDNTVPEESSNEQSSSESLDSSDLSSDLSSETSSEESSEDSSEDVSSEESSETSSDETSSDDISSGTIVDPELENELIGLIGTPNDNPMFDLVITAPEKYNAGDDIVVTVSVRNIKTQYGIDYLKFMFYYDNTKLMLTNDINERNQGSLICIDDESIGSGWESFVIVSSNFNDLTPDDLRGGVQAVPTNDGVIDVSLLTPVLYLDSITEDDVIVFEFTFTAFEDAEDDFGIYIPHTNIKGALNENYGLDFFVGNGGYAIVTFDSTYVQEESSDEVSDDISSDTSSDVSDESEEDSSTDESSEDVSSDISSEVSSEDISSDVSSDESNDVSSDVSSDISSDSSDDVSSDDASSDDSSNESSDDVSSDVSSEPEWEIPDINVYDYVFEIDAVNGTIQGEDTIIITSTDFYKESDSNWCTTVVLDRLNDAVYRVNRIIDNPITDVTLENGQLALIVHSYGDRPEDEYGTYPNWEARAVAKALQVGDKLILDKVVLTDNRECINGTATVKSGTDTSPDPTPNHGTSGIVYKLSDDGTYCYIDSYNGDENEVTVPSVYMGLPVAQIAENAFENKNITAIIIPESISEIGTNAFNGCESLLEIYCESESQPASFNEFWLGSSSATVLWGYTYDVALKECEDWIDIFNALNREDYCEPEWNNLQSVLSTAQAALTDADSIFKLRPIMKALEYAHLISPKIKEFADINSDEVIDVFDYLLLKRACFGTYELNEVQYSRGNLDRNNVIDVFDYLLIKRIAFSTYTVQ